MIKGKFLAAALLLGACTTKQNLPPGLAAQASSSESATAAVTGRWQGELVKPEGGRRRYQFVLRDEKGNLSGTVFTPSGSSPITAGKVTGNEITFTAKGGAFHGIVTGTHLDLTMPASRGRTQALAAERVSADPVPEPPPVITLPPVQVLPPNGLALTPPMGWNSWNKFQTRIDDKLIREIADAMVKSGMKAAGYTFVNIDDGWEGERGADGTIATNPRFPDMKALAGYLHDKGLKLGIYSSPGFRTCAGFEGSLNHEAQDAGAFAAWGIDYLKYDWCTAALAYRDDQMQAAYQKMGEALRATGRPIVYSLCQYGREHVQTWGAAVGGNLWRTTGDISDHWDKMSSIGFDKQAGLEAHAAPGHWNDPDMLEVGNGGMTDDEYRTHMSLWALLAAPLIAGNDLRQMAPAVRAILTNADVIAVDQDKAGSQGRRLTKDGDVETWARPLAGGGTAVGLFNRGAQAATATVRWTELGITGRRKLRDLWQGQARGTADAQYSAEVPAHGVVLVSLSK
jgi:alpha-galactosidase